MAKLTLQDVAAGYLSVATHNANNTLLETALENTLSRDGTSPNTMEANLDMNSYRVTNLPTAVNNSEPVTLAQAASIAGVTNPLTQDTVAAVLWPETAAETSAGVTPTNYQYEPGNVLRYGTNTTPGTTDMTTAIQAALNSNTLVIFPRGQYACGALTIPDWVTLQGEGHPVGIGTGGDAGPVALHYTGTSGTFVTGGNTVVIKNLYFDGGGSYDSGTGALTGTTAVGLQLGADAIVEECTFALWPTAIRFATNSYYSRFERVEFNRCTYGYRAQSGGAPYDIDIISPTSRLTQIFIAGAGSAYPRNIKVWGGSIEGYQNVASAVLDATFHGTYFETSAPWSSVIAFDSLPTGCSLSFFGCVIYLTLHARWVNMSGLSSVALTSVGNTFAGIGPASSYVYYLPSTGDVTLAGDRFGTTHDNTCLYVQSIAAAQPYHVQMPLIPSANSLGTYSQWTFPAQREVVELVTTTNVITTNEAGKVFYLNAAGGFTSTLPAPAVGLKYTFIVKTAPTTAYIVTTDSGANILYGTLLDIVGEQVAITAQDTINFVANTSLIGDSLEVQSDGTNWYVTAKSLADGGITVAVT